LQVRLSTSGGSHAAAALWLQALVRHSAMHGSMLPALMSMRSMLKQRCANIGQLMQLKGKLEMMQTFQ
jgi:hypothetical protein